MVSARPKNRWSSTWQKYCDRNSSCVQTMRAPDFMARSARRTWLSRLATGSSPHDICVRPTLTMRLEDDGVRREAIADLSSYSTVQRWKTVADKLGGGLEMIWVCRLQSMSRLPAKELKTR